MSWRTHPAVTVARNVGRALGLNSLLSLVTTSRRYEAAFHDQVMGAIRPGDCVWDIGANIGFYTKLFSERVGAAGQVFAFEPSPTNRDRLNEAVKGLHNVVVVPVALSNASGTAVLQQGDDSLGATSRLLDSPVRSGVPVQVKRGDELLAEGIAAPSVIKVDTEGFEVEVLEGLAGVLASPRLRAAFVEVHFGVLAERGVKNGPRRVEAMLSSAGFTCTWPDLSHIVAIRQGM
jgi:FkbM family methyltransferase